MSSRVKCSLTAVGIGQDRRWQYLEEDVDERIGYKLNTPQEEYGTTIAYFKKDETDKIGRLKILKQYVISKYTNLIDRYTEDLKTLNVDRIEMLDGPQF